MAVHIALVIGPTPGHVYPALALADAIHEEHAGADVVLVGPADNGASALIDEHRYRLTVIPALPLARASVGQQVQSVLQLMPGIHVARRVLVSEHVDTVLSFGSYASGAALIAARSLGLTTAIHEGNSEPGLANRLLARFAHRVYLGTEVPQRDWCSGKPCKTIGTPIRKVIFGSRKSRTRGPVGRAVRLLVLGGTLGADFLARELPRMLAEAARHGLTVEVRHQAGEDSAEGLCVAYERAGISARVEPFIDDIGGAYRWADFAIARSGASTISEFEVVGLPALLVPWSGAARDHQLGNARAFAESGCGLWSTESEWSAERIARQLIDFMGSETAWVRASQALSGRARPQAARCLARELLELSAANG